MVIVVVQLLPVGVNATVAVPGVVAVNIVPATLPPVVPGLARANVPLLDTDKLRL
jgi:hypothetical protein